MSLTKKDELQAIADNIRSSADRVLAEYIYQGEQLLIAKSMLPDFEFCDWIEKNFEWSHAHANNLMRLPAFIAENPEFLEYSEKYPKKVGVSALSILSQGSLPERALSEYKESCESGAPMSVRALKKISKENKASKPESEFISHKYAINDYIEFNSPLISAPHLRFGMISRLLNEDDRLGYRIIMPDDKYIDVPESSVVRACSRRPVFDRPMRVSDLSGKWVLRVNGIRYDLRDYDGLDFFLDPGQEDLSNIAGICLNDRLVLSSWELSYVEDASPFVESDDAGDVVDLADDPSTQLIVEDAYPPLSPVVSVLPYELEDSDLSGDYEDEYQDENEKFLEDAYSLLEHLDEFSEKYGEYFNPDDFQALRHQLAVSLSSSDCGGDERLEELQSMSWAKLRGLCKKYNVDSVSTRHEMAIALFEAGI